MIQLKIKNMDHKAVLTVPAEYERVTLWSALARTSFVPAAR